MVLNDAQGRLTSEENATFVEIRNEEVGEVFDYGGSVSVDVKGSIQHMGGDLVMADNKPDVSVGKGALTGRQIRQCDAR